jgi:hypothetical protein
LGTSPLGRAIDRDSHARHAAVRSSRLRRKAYIVAVVLDVEAMWKAVEGTSSKGTHSCLPSDGIENGQVLRILKKWLDQTPENRADSFLHNALGQAFPCK